MTDDALEQRLEKIETKVAYHEVATMDANKTIYALELRVAQLEQALKLMAKQLKQLGFSGDDSPDQTPPHY